MVQSKFNLVFWFISYNFFHRWISGIHVACHLSPLSLPPARTRLLSGEDDHARPREARTGRRTTCSSAKSTRRPPVRLDSVRGNVPLRPFFFPCKRILQMIYGMRCSQSEGACCYRCMAAGPSLLRPEMAVLWCVVPTPPASHWLGMHMCSSLSTDFYSYLGVASVAFVARGCLDGKYLKFGYRSIFVYI
jgi:hypothetical protein